MSTPTTPRSRHWIAFSAMISLSSYGKARSRQKMRHRRGDDVVEVLLAAAVPLHRVEAELHRRDVVLAVRAADDLVNAPLDRQRRALDELGPVEQLEVAVERAIAPRGHGDHVPEFPVVLGRELDPLGVRDPPHDRRGDRAAEMAMELRKRGGAGELARHRSKHTRRPGRSVVCRGTGQDGVIV
jgi:hypothetical protein